MLYIEFKAIQVPHLSSLLLFFVFVRLALLAFLAALVASSSQSCNERWTGFFFFFLTSCCTRFSDETIRNDLAVDFAWAMMNISVEPSGTT